MSKKAYLREQGPHDYLLFHLMVEEGICTRKRLKEVCKGGNTILNDKNIPDNLFDLLYSRLVGKFSTAEIIDGRRGSYGIKSEHMEDVRTVLGEKRKVYARFLKD